MVFEVDAWVIDVHDDYPDQVRIIGPTPRGRFITLAVTPDGAPDSWRLVTGWLSTPAEIAYHREEYR